MQPVLLVEDDKDIRELLSDLLREEGYTVVSAANGREALCRLQKERPGLILLDLKMPAMTGAEFCAAQREHPELASIPVVLLSADRGVDRKAQALRVAGYLRKPIALEDLLAIVRRYCAAMP